MNLYNVTISGNQSLVSGNYTVASFLTYCAESMSGPAPDAILSGYEYVWQYVDLGDAVVLSSTDGEVSYVTNTPNGLDAGSEEAALVLTSSINGASTLLLFTQLDALSSDACATAVEQLGGPSPLLVAAILTACTDTSSIRYAMNNIAAAMAGEDQAPLLNNVVGICNFVGWPCAITTGGEFGARTST